MVSGFLPEPVEVWGIANYRPRIPGGSGLFQKLVLEPKAAQTIAMVLHELTTNAVKYGALSVPSGRLRVKWSRGEAGIVIRWSEADGPPVKAPRHHGFGTRLVGPIVQNGLEGNYSSIGILTGSTVK